MLVIHSLHVALVSHSCEEAFGSGYSCVLALQKPLVIIMCLKVIGKSMEIATFVEGFRKYYFCGNYWGPLELTICVKVLASL